jgi:hypothetical protein
MHSITVRVTVLATLCAAALAAQSGGIPPEWEVHKQLSSLVGHIERFKPVLEQLKPEDWTKQGAPAAYQNQLQRTRAEIEYLAGSSKQLAARPERVTLALETFLRLQAVDALLRSVAAGVRKYQNPAIADLIESMISDAGADRDQLRQYLVDLAADREQQFAVVDQEAQRCRAALVRQPAGPVRKPEPKEERR